MEIAAIVLEYLKVVLAAPVLISGIFVFFVFYFKTDVRSLLNRIATIKLPGGTELTTSQLKNSEAEKGNKPKPKVNDYGDLGLPDDLPDNVKEDILMLLKNQKSTSYLWEYRYLNLFFVRGTQIVLDWLVSLTERVTYSHYDTIWQPLIVSTDERGAIIRALESHSLVLIDSSGFIEVTEKGREYHKWRGELPPLPESTNR